MANLFFLSSNKFFSECFGNKGCKFLSGLLSDNLPWCCYLRQYRGKQNIFPSTMSRPFLLLNWHNLNRAKGRKSLHTFGSEVCSTQTMESLSYTAKKAGFCAQSQGFIEFPGEACVAWGTQTGVLLKYAGKRSGNISAWLWQKSAFFARCVHAFGRSGCLLMGGDPCGFCAENELRCGLEVNFSGKSRTMLTRPPSQAPTSWSEREIFATGATHFLARQWSWPSDGSSLHFLQNMNHKIFFLRKQLGGQSNLLNFIHEHNVKGSDFITAQSQSNLHETSPVKCSTATHTKISDFQTRFEE